MYHRQWHGEQGAQADRLQRAECGAGGKVFQSSMGRAGWPRRQLSSDVGRRGLSSPQYLFAIIYIASVARNASSPATYLEFPSDANH